MTEFFGPMQQRTARRSHYCHTCHRQIQPKEQYTFQSVLWDGHWYDFHQCQHAANVASTAPRTAALERNDGALYPVPASA